MTFYKIALAARWKLRTAVDFRVEPGAEADGGPQAWFGAARSFLKAGRRSLTSSFGFKGRQQ
jgi:hypothetical protein